jgi:hypothetical protein
MDVTYDELGDSKPVVLTIPAAKRRAYLGFVLETNKGWAGWSGYGTPGNIEQFVDLAEPEGHMVRVPMRSGAGYPFTWECYDIDVEDANSPTGWAAYDGMVRQVMLGLTTSSKEDYLANNDVPWEDVTGARRAIGVAEQMYIHDGGYYGTMVQTSTWVWVPAGRNLVWKLVIDRYAGVCGYSDDTTFIERTATQTYFHEVQ